MGCAGRWRERRRESNIEEESHGMQLTSGCRRKKKKYQGNRIWTKYLTMVLKYRKMTSFARFIVIDENFIIIVIIMVIIIILSLHTSSVSTK